MSIDSQNILQPPKLEYKKQSILVTGIQPIKLDFNIDDEPKKNIPSFILKSIKKKKESQLQLSNNSNFNNAKKTPKKLFGNKTKFSIKDEIEKIKQQNPNIEIPCLFSTNINNQAISDKQTNYSPEVENAQQNLKTVSNQIFLSDEETCTTADTSEFETDHFSFQLLKQQQFNFNNIQKQSVQCKSLFQSLPQQQQQQQQQE